MKKAHAFRWRAAALLVIAAIGLGACGGMQAASEKQAIGIQTADEMRTFLTDVRAAASAYGRKHLGHFLDLDRRRLGKRGLEVPSGTRLRVTTDHEGYCVAATASTMTAEDKWSTATVSSGIKGISAADRCSG